MPTCKKCECTFANKVKIDGKTRNLQNRKFCLTCSPFGSRNTKPDDPSRESARPVVDGQRASYSDWTDEAKDEFRARLYWKAQNRKEKLVKELGGCCEKCGYDKSMRALTFHHKDPAEKEFPLDKRSIQSLSWKEIMKEANKCELLCIRCHMEIEEDIFESKYEAYREKFSHLGK